jgi:hypothetical protein
MVRKGKVAEILSKALYSDSPELYSVGYLDLGETKNIPLLEFLKLSENFEVIPASRIVFIMKENVVCYSKINGKKSDQK